MRDADPSTQFQSQQKYYTDQNADFDNLKLPARLNDSPSASQNDEFYFDPAEHVVVTTDSITAAKTTKYELPGMKLNLNKEYFKTYKEILDVNGVTIGYALIGEQVQGNGGFVNIVDKMTKSVTMIALGLVISILLFMF